MKVGEIWEYCGTDAELEEHFYSNGMGTKDSRVKILFIIKPESMEMAIDAMEISNDDLEDFVEFEHITNKAIGVLDRNDFVKLYRKVYE